MMLGINNYEQSRMMDSKEFEQMGSEQNERNGR